ncbi:MAG: metallophosphoesterase family protein [Lachnospiraceae bacterium]
MGGERILRKDSMSKRKIVVFSDIHGNAMALEQMIQQEKDVDLYVFLGDIIGYYFEQEKVVKLLKTLPNLYCVKGNHDKNYEELMDGKREDIEELVKQYGSSYRLRSKEVYEFIKHMPESFVISEEHMELLCVHGSPNDPLHGRIYPSDTVNHLDVPYKIVLQGHTHYRLEKSNEQTNFLNPGSLGQPRDGKGFSYGVLQLEENQWNFSFEHITLDLEEFKNHILPFCTQEEYCYRIIEERYVK